MKPSVSVGIHNCASEPIHIPETIQAYGFLVAFSTETLVVDYVSDNATPIVGESILGKKISDLLPELTWNQLQTELANDSRERLPFFPVTFNGEDYVFTYYRSGHEWVLEFEKDLANQDPSFLSVYKDLNRSISAMDRAEDFQNLCDLTARAVRNLIDFERVMIYKFDTEWNGTVIAEDLGAQVESYLGLQYPASDIPSQARALYERNWLRYTPDVNYKASALMVRSELGAEPLDQSLGRLRAVSPIHLQYLRNMKVGSSVSISIKKNGVLWGLVACLNPKAKHISFEIRQGMELIGKHFSLQIMTKERSGDEAHRRELFSRVGKLTLQMKAAGKFIDGLTGPEESYLKLARGVTGGSILYRDQMYHFGKVEEKGAEEFLNWLTGYSKGPLFSTTSLEKIYPPGSELRASASGVLAISIPEGHPFWIALYKPEVIQTVNWGGNPDKPLEVDSTGTFLGPRRSFEIWKQEVKGTSLPWAPEEIDALLDLRRTVIEVDLERQVRSALESNDELDNYARVISHDLKEPLRGIANLAGFLEEDLTGKLQGESAKNLTDISSLANKMRNLISELYQYSKIGKIDLAVAPVDLNEIVQEARERLSPFLKENHATIAVPEKLPTISCDRVRVTEVFVNLFTNAVKYNRSSEKKITVRAEDTKAGPQILVSDNGIGVPPENRKEIFRMFKRLHAEGEFGGGTGAGLPIVKKIIDRHGGKISVTGDDSGSTFRFTLSPEHA